MEKIITKNQVIHTIGAKLGEEFSTDGFKYIKSKKDLIRKTKKGFDRVIFNTYDAYPISHQKLSIGFQKRINSIEDIINQFYDERFRNPEFHKYSITIHLDYKLLKELYSSDFKSENNRACEICTQIKNLDVEGFILHTEQDIEDVTSLLITFIREKVLPFFEMNTNLDYVNKKQKESNKTPTLGPLPIDPIMHSLVLMKLTGDKEFDTLKKEYLERMVNPHDEFGRNKLEIKAVEELISYLEKTELKDLQ